MAIRILTPAGSLVKFTDTDVEHCVFGTVKMNLPVFEPEDVAFQFVLDTDTIEEADALAVFGSGVVTLSINGSLGLLAIPSGQLERFRIGDKQVLYNFTGGLTGFDTVVVIDECFDLQIDVAVDSGYSFNSTPFERINEYKSCFTSVLDYNNDDNAFGFNYCATESIVDPPPDGGGPCPPDPEPTICTPLRIAFTNMSSMLIPYTTGMLDMYGTMPTVQIWIYEDNGELVLYTLEAKLDAYPPTELRLDFGGNSSGVVIIK